MPNLPYTQSSKPNWPESYKDERHQTPCKEMICIQLACGFSEQLGRLSPRGSQSSVFWLCPFQHMFLRVGRVIHWGLMPSGEPALPVSSPQGLNLGSPMIEENYPPFFSSRGDSGCHDACVEDNL